MDNESHEFTELEAELKQLRPAAPSPELLARLASELAPAVKPTSAISRPAPRTISPWWLLVSLPAAAAFTFILTSSALRRPPTSAADLTLASANDTASTAPLFKPVSSENVLYDARDEGIVQLADGTPARRVRESYVDTLVWKNPRTNASLRWTVPRDEVRVVPVIFQ